MTYDPIAPGSHDPTTGWTQDAASGFQPPAPGAIRHNHSILDLTDLTNITSLTNVITIIKNAVLPVGLISPYYGVTPPSSWLMCDGSSFSSVTYPALASLLGGTTLPDLKGKVVVGIDAGQIEFDVLGETGGSKTVALATAELASHGHSHNHGSHAHSHSHAWTHSSQFGNHDHPYIASAQGNIGLTSGANNYNLNTGTINTGTDSTPHSHTGTNAVDAQLTTPSTDATATGSGTAHQNLQPYIAISYIIKAA